MGRKVLLPDESARQKAFARYRLARGEAYPDLQPLVELARAVCRASAAFIYIADTEPWLICQDGGPLPDLHRLLEQPHLWPLICPEGIQLGGLGVVEPQVAPLDEQQRKALQTLSAQVITCLELEREKRERRVSEHRLRLVTDHARVGLVAFDRDYRYVYCNRTYAQMVRMEVNDLLGRTPGEFLPETCYQGIRQRVDLAFAGQASVDEVNGPLPDVWSVVHYQRAEDLVVVVLVDVTERNQTEERTQFALRSAGVGTWDSVVGSGKTRWSPELEAQYGFAPGEFSGDVADFLARVHPDDHAIFLNRYEDSDEFSYTNRAVWPDGTTRWLRVIGKLLRDVHGKPLRTVGVCQDITEQLRLEEQVRQSQKMEAVGRLAGGVAHDFNNLLAVILGLTEVLRTELGSDDPRLVHLEDIEQASESATAVVRQLLTFSRKQSLEPCLVDVNSVILGMQCMLRRLISHDVIIDLQLAEEPLQARVDRFQLEQVLLNLAVNARDAMPLGGRLSCSTGGSPNRLWLRVRDTGPGIPAGILEQIFDPFFTTKEAGRGTGLGLSTVHGIVTQSEGSIQAYNNLEGGACFEVQLPRVANSIRAD